MTRRESRRPTRQRFLVLTEGENTEPVYLNALVKTLRLSEYDVKVEVIHGRYTDPSGILDDVTTRRDQAEKVAKKSGDSRDRAYDHVWIVFDTEGPQNGRADALPKVRSQAQNGGVRIAESTPSFEVWYLLHFDSTPPSCGNGKNAVDALKGKLKAAKLPLTYGKSASDAQAIAAWALSDKRTYRAVTHATKLPADARTRTDVHRLVLALAEQSTHVHRAALGWPNT